MAEDAGSLILERAPDARFGPAIAKSLLWRPVPSKELRPHGAKKGSPGTTREQVAVYKPACPLRRGTCSAWPPVINASKRLCEVSEALYVPQNGIAVGARICAADPGLAVSDDSGKCHGRVRRMPQLRSQAFTDARRFRFVPGNLPLRRAVQNVLEPSMSKAIAVIAGACDSETTVSAQRDADRLLAAAHRNFSAAQTHSTAA